MSVLGDPRVLFAAERTLMAWNRTSITLMAFGFLVERAGLLMQALSPGSVDRLAQELNFWLGLAFIGLGVVAAYYSSRQYLVVLRTLNSQEFPRGYAPRWGLLVNALVALLGAVLVVALYLGRHAIL